MTVATHAFGPWFGALGGMFIIVDYYLTASISAVSGFGYLNSLFPLGPLVMWGAIAGIAFLGILNVIGIRESARVTALVAVLAFIVDIILVLFVGSQIGPVGWHVVFSSLTQVRSLTPWALLTGFAGSFLAFSGLESISQLSPVMETPRRKIASIAMILVVVAILFTSPLLTLFSTNLLTAKTRDGKETILEAVREVKSREARLPMISHPEEKKELEEKIHEGVEYSERFISELGAQYAGQALKIAVVATASILLLFAANTAIIGAYHVFIALSRQNFLPYFLQTHNNRFGTPHWSVLLAITPPILIILGTRGDVTILGALYAFGLLGAFGLSSLGLDIVRFREGQRKNILFLLGLLTTFLVFIAWGTNLYHKEMATYFGGGITLFGMLIAYIIHTYFPHTHIAVTVTVEKDLSQIPEGQILLPVYEEFDPSLYDFVGTYAKQSGKSVVLIYLREFSDILQGVSESFELDEEAETFLTKAKTLLDGRGISVKVLYETTTAYGDAINTYRRKLKPELTILSPRTHNLMFNFLKGKTVEKVLAARGNLGNVLIHPGNGMHAKKKYSSSL